MSIIVNGRGIPDKGCMNCHYRTGKYCGIKTENDYVYDNVFTYTRPKDCPITELVCCKDCKHWQLEVEACFVHVQSSEDADSIILNMQADDFCSKGERKEE